MLTLRSGMLNLLLVERLLVRVVAAIILSHVCWQVFSPGAEINQNSVMVTALVQLEITERKLDLDLLVVLKYRSLVNKTLTKTAFVYLSAALVWLQYR